MARQPDNSTAPGVLRRKGAKAPPPAASPPIPTQIDTPSPAPVATPATAAAEAKVGMVTPGGVAATPDDFDRLYSRAAVLADESNGALAVPQPPPGAELPEASDAVGSQALLAPAAEKLPGLEPDALRRLAGIRAVQSALGSDFREGQLRQISEPGTGAWGLLEHDVMAPAVADAERVKAEQQKIDVFNQFLSRRALRMQEYMGQSAAQRAQMDKLRLLGQQRMDQIGAQGANSARVAGINAAGRLATQEERNKGTMGGGRQSQVVPEMLDLALANYEKADKLFSTGQFSGLGVAAMHDNATLANQKPEGGVVNGLTRGLRQLAYNKTGSPWDQSITPLLFGPNLDTVIRIHTGRSVTGQQLQYLNEKLPSPADPPEIQRQKLIPFVEGLRAVRDFVARGKSQSAAAKLYEMFPGLRDNSRFPIDTSGGFVQPVDAPDAPAPRPPPVGAAQGKRGLSLDDFRE